MEFKANDARGHEFLLGLEKRLDSAEEIRNLFEYIIIKNGFKGYHELDGWVSAPKGLYENVNLRWERGSISQIWIITAFSEVPMNVDTFKRCFRCLKKTSICQRCLYILATTEAFHAVLLVKKWYSLPVVLSQK